MDGTARIVWKLPRNHTWGTPMKADQLLRVAATDEDHDEMRKHLETVLDLSFVSRGPDGVYFPTVNRRTWMQQIGFERTPSVRIS